MNVERTCLAAGLTTGVWPRSLPNLNTHILLHRVHKTEWHRQVKNMERGKSERFNMFMLPERKPQTKNMTLRMGQHCTVAVFR